MPEVSKKEYNFEVAHYCVNNAEYQHNKRGCNKHARNVDPESIILEQAVEDALSQMLGVPAKLIQPGSRAAAGGDPMTISLPLTANTGLGAHLTVCQCCDDTFTPVMLTADVLVDELCRGSRV